MSPYFESIRIQNQQVHLWPYHVARLHRTRSVVFGLKDPLDIPFNLPNDIDDGIWKCRIVYGETIEQITFMPYTSRSIQSIKAIQADDDLDYTHKGDRSDLLALYEQRGDADDILIIRDGFVTDSYWSNVLLSQGGRWFTPATPLLRGVMRQSLLDSGMITERIIRLADIEKYDQIMMVNALNPFDVGRAMHVEGITGRFVK